MFAKQNLISFHILERESKQSSLVTWTYPTITEDMKTYINSRGFPTTTVENNLFFYLRKDKVWIYIKQYICKNNQKALVVIAEEFLPAKYKVLCNILTKEYLKTNNPVDLVKLYLKLFTSGSICYHENGSELSLDLKEHRSEPKVKDLIKNFGLEVVLIFIGILLKRRIIVYHHDIEKLQEKIVAITNLVLIRNSNDYLYPLVESPNELKGSPFYLAGTNSENICSSENNFDLHVNLVENELVISKGAKDCFVLAKVHKDLAHFLVQLSESDLSESAVSDQIKAKTLDILKQLSSLATCEMGNKKMVTVSNLKSKNFNVALENFLFNLAVAENMMMF